MFASSNLPRQCAINLFGFYDLSYDDLRMSLFLTLKVLNDSGIPTCIHNHAPAEERYSDIYPSSCRCNFFLNGKDHNADLCTAFRNLCFYVEDPLLKSDDRKLRQEVNKFASHLLCEKHQSKDRQAVLAHLMEKISLCRKLYLFHGRDFSPRSDDSSAEYFGSGSNRQQSRLSKLLPKPRKPGSLEHQPHHRERSTSPSSFSSGENSYAVQRSVSEKHVIKPKSSAPEMKMPRHVSWDLKVTETPTKERDRTRTKQVEDFVGRKASTMMTKLSPKIG